MALAVMHWWCTILACSSVTAENRKRGAKRRASVNVWIPTRPSSSAAAAVYWKLNFPSSPDLGCGRSASSISGVKIRTARIDGEDTSFRRASSAASIGPGRVAEPVAMVPSAP